MGMERTSWRSFIGGKTSNLCVAWKANDDDGDDDNGNDNYMLNGALFCNNTLKFRDHSLKGSREV